MKSISSQKEQWRRLYPGPRLIAAILPQEWQSVNEVEQVEQYHSGAQSNFSGLDGRDSKICEHLGQCGITT
ncbi:MAG: hypothetical protein HQL69_17500 [Magnetococcales bacterium]|nr:hypothetical protein [Magnetococcales bacterium]